MASNKKKRKIRTEFRKKHQPRTRTSDFTRQFQQQNSDFESAPASERISGKGELTRRRTIIGAESTEDESGLGVQLDVDTSACLAGRVLAVHGLASDVQTEDGQPYRCATRGLLKTLSTEMRHVVAAGDRVMFRPVNDEEGLIERIEPRRGVISRTSRGKRHIIVVNVDQMLIIASAAEPMLKPNLIDRFLITAEKANIKPIICINKADLADPADLQPLLGVYGQMGYEALLTSVKTGLGLARIRRLLTGRQSAVAGQSGVGKSSLLNAVAPELALRIGEISADTQKGRHTTTTAQLLPLSFGGYVVDTPGIRQFQLWDVIPEEAPGYFRDLRPFVALCRFPDCTHTHEESCAVKDAVADGKLDARRYESYCRLAAGDEA